MQPAGLAPFIDCSNVKYWCVQMCLEYEIQGITLNLSDHLQQILKFWVILEEFECLLNLLRPVFFYN